jgi:hypothetical protein
LFVVLLHFQLHHSTTPYSRPLTHPQPPSSFTITITNAYTNLNPITHPITLTLSNPNPDKDPTAYYFNA